MKKWRYLLVASLLTSIVHDVQCQVNFMETNNFNFQYGYSIKATLEIDKPWNFYLALNGGVASNFIAPEVYPSINGELLIYTGGLASAKPLQKQNWFLIDFILAGTVTAGFGRNNFRTSNQSEIEQWNIPLYYFSNFSYPALVNPYYSSMSIGTNLVWSKGRFPQRIGFINIHPVKEFQISYYNDGGVPVEWLYLGDLEDRYYTGGATISYHGPAHTQLNLVEFGYHKFTGHSKNSYKVAKRLNLAFVDYVQPEQAHFNRSLWTLNVANPQKHWGINLRSYNKTSWDMQHKIHWTGYSPYHIVAHPSAWSISGEAYLYRNYVGLR